MGQRQTNNQLLDGRERELNILKNKEEQKCKQNIFNNNKIIYFILYKFK